MYYFGYCTWLDDAELRRFMPNAKQITQAVAPNHRLTFHAADDRTDRGWCHFNNKCADAWGTMCRGVVFEHENIHFKDDYDDFERCTVTVIGLTTGWSLTGLMRMDTRAGLLVLPLIVPRAVKQISSGPL